MSLTLILQQQGGLRQEPGGPPTENQQASSLYAATKSARRLSVQREAGEMLAVCWTKWRLEKEHFQFTDGFL